MDQVEDLTFVEFIAAFEAMNKIKMQERLELFLVSDYPNMKDDMRKKLHAQSRKLAYDDDGSKGAKISNADLAKILLSR